jgi:hypothetical protein
MPRSLHQQSIYQLLIALGERVTLARAAHIATLAALVRQHGHPCRIVVGRKTGRVMLRAGMPMGYDRSAIKCNQRNSWRIELVRPDLVSVREWLGY